MKLLQIEVHIQMDSTSVFTILLLSVVLFFLGKWILRRVEIAKCMKVFPGPKPLPLIGNALEFKNTQGTIDIKFIIYIRKKNSYYFSLILSERLQVQNNFGPL